MSAPLPPRPYFVFILVPGRLRRNVQRPYLTAYGNGGCWMLSNEIQCKLKPAGIGLGVIVHEGNIVCLSSTPARVSCVTQSQHRFVHRSQQFVPGSVSLVAFNHAGGVIS